MTYDVSTELANQNPPTISAGRTKKKGRTPVSKKSNPNGAGKTPMSKGVGSKASSEGSQAGKAIGKISKGKLDPAATTAAKGRPVVNGRGNPVKATGQVKGGKAAGPGRGAMRNSGRGR